jgi:ATP-dependent DNA ligase
MPNPVVASPKTGRGCQFSVRKPNSSRRCCCSHRNRSPRARWTYELKLDGYRAIGVKTGGTVRLRSRNDKDFAQKYPGIARALAALPDDTVVDGEVVPLDEAGRPSFNALQNGATRAAIFYYVFDVMILRDRNIILPKDKTGSESSHILRKCRQIPETTHSR